MRSTITKWVCRVGVAILTLSMTDCANNPNAQGTQTMPTRPIEAVLKEHTDELMTISGVVGTAQSLCDGKDCIHVYVVEMNAALEEKIPKMLEGYPVEVVTTGEIKARPGL
jgi:hypothetical protein